LNRYAWIDKYRFIIMLDSSAIAYSEMALCNIAYSYIQLGDMGWSCFGGHQSHLTSILSF
jgi:hypothetical protein